METVHRLASSFDRALSDALMSQNKDDTVTSLKKMSIVFNEVCAIVESCEAEKQRMKDDNIACLEECHELKKKTGSYDDVVQQLHLALNAKSSDKFAKPVYEKMNHEISENLRKIDNFHTILAKYEIEVKRNRIMAEHVDELSKRTVLQQISARFFAREVATVRQMMNLIQNSPNVEQATKSRLWDQIEAENNILRSNTLWLINRINGGDRDDGIMPRVVLLIRSHMHQGLGLEITGGCETFRPIIVTAKLKGSMADDDQLRIGDRIIAIDGNFLSDTTSHSNVMKMLETESAKDYLALVVSAFNPWSGANNQSNDVSDTVV